MTDLTRIVLARGVVSRLRPAADAFAEVALAGGRRLADRRDDGSLGFESPAVEEIFGDLGEALEVNVPEADQRLIAERLGGPFERFIDRLAIAWLRAEPDLTQFLIPDRRGSGAFLFEVMRAELRDLGIDLQIEPRPVGYRIQRFRSRRRVIGPVVMCVWFGGMAGWLLEGALGVGSGAEIGFGAGVVLGLLLGLRAMLFPEPATCSECGIDVTASGDTCGQCGTALRTAAEAEEAEEASARAECRAGVATSAPD